MKNVGLLIIFLISVKFMAFMIERMKYCNLIER